MRDNIYHDSSVYFVFVLRMAKFCVSNSHELWFYYRSLNHHNYNRFAWITGTFKCFFVYVQTYISTSFSKDL